MGLGSGREVPLLAGVVELGPLADDGAVRGLAVERVEDHAVADSTAPLASSNGAGVRALPRRDERSR